MLRRSKLEPGSFSFLNEKRARSHPESKKRTNPGRAIPKKRNPNVPHRIKRPPPPPPSTILPLTPRPETHSPAKPSSKDVQHREGRRDADEAEGKFLRFEKLVDAGEGEVYVYLLSVEV